MKSKNIVVQNVGEDQYRIIQLENLAQVSISFKESARINFIISNEELDYICGVKEYHVKIII